MNRHQRMIASLIGWAVLGASFLPWATLAPPTGVTAAPLLRGLPAHLAIGAMAPQGTLTAWRGSFTLGGYGLPNAILVVAALGLPIWIRWSWLAIAIALGGLLHLGLFALAIAGLAGGALGPGYGITLLAYGGLLAWRLGR